MGTFTRLDDADIAALAAAFGLGEVRAWRAIEAGTVNTNAALECARGAFFLRINEGKSEPDVRYEGDLVAALADAGVPTPRPVRASDGQTFARYGGKLVSAFPWVAGAHRGVDDDVRASDSNTDVGPAHTAAITETHAAAITEAHAAALGRALAGLHVAGLAIAGRFERAGIYTLDHIAARYRGFCDHPDPHLAPAIAAIEAELSWLAGDADTAATRARAQTGVIHGDLFPDNVIWRGDDLAALLDFEQASTGSLAYDLAVCINAWCWRDEAFAPALVRALVAGYRDVRALHPDEIAALAVEARAAALRFTVTRITDVYLPGVDNPPKDFRYFLARLAAWQALGAAGFRACAGLV